ncbi:putative bifunctional diguanylate cyclase/phosphodiesterase [Leptolyngbyaceae cyanobacterium UHCC 1019]
MTEFWVSVTTFANQLRSRFHPLPGWRDRKLSLSRSLWVTGRSIVLSSTVVAGLIGGIQQVGGLEIPELLVFNWFTQLQPDKVPDPRLLIVTITEHDLHRYRWPLSDQTLAQALTQLQANRPKVIGLDLYRDITNPPGASALATQLQAKNLIAITEIIGDISSPPGVEPERVGFNDLALDADGVLRRNLLFVAGSDQTYYSFALRMSLLYLRSQDILFRHSDQALFLGENPIAALEPTSGGYQTADTRGYQTLLNYRARSHVAQTVTLSQVLDGDVNPEWVRDKIVLIGTIAPSLKDQVYTPYSTSQQDRFQMSGVIIHAQMTSQLLDIATGEQRLFQFWTQEGELLWLWSWAFIGGLLVWQLRHPLSFGIASIVCLLAIGGIGWGLFGNLIWIPVAEPMLGFMGAVGLAMAHRLLYTTTRDPLTGLLNRDAFVQHLQRSLTHIARPKATSNLGVIFLHLDRLQLINESLGSQMGDRVLLQVIARWQAILPRSVHLARIGDDEFALFLEHSQKGTLTTLADKLQSALTKPFLINQHAIVTTTSIGIAVTQTDHRHTPENLLRDAHTAMYRAKALGAARYQVFATGMLTETVDRFTLENELRQGIDAQEFVLYYQPIICLSTEKIVGFEALVRWQHPTQGFVLPFKFIPLAEETGLIIPLGAWICQSACQQAHQWQHQFPIQPLMISINLSGRQFEQPDLIEQFKQIIQDADIQETTLKLEITESMVMGDADAAIDLMLRLKSLGCKLSMDDFGTGYSSLSQLRRFPVDTLKVDKSFVQKMGESHEDHEIVRMIISLGHTLGMDVVAEGVETKAEADALRSLGCEFGQGYFWAKPLPAAEATALLQQQA